MHGTNKGCGLSQSELYYRINDEDPWIRYVVARYIDVKFLNQMINDKSALVREAVAKRIDKEIACLMWALDENKHVRNAARDNVLGIK
jgi:hypothetical protein